MATSPKRLQPYHYVAIDLRQKGKTYPDIAKVVNRAPQTVTNWFNNDPVFRAEFARLTAESVELARLKIVNAMPDAADFLIALMGHEHGTTALGAVKDVLDRGGLKPPSEHRLGGPHGDAIQIEHKGSLTDAERAERVAALLQLIRSRVAGSPAE